MKKKMFIAKYHQVNKSAVWVKIPKKFYKKGMPRHSQTRTNKKRTEKLELISKSVQESNPRKRSSRHRRNVKSIATS